MKICLIIPYNWLIKLGEELEKLCEVVYEPSSDCDAIVCMTIGERERMYAAHDKYPDIPLFNYNWDIYEWVWERPRAEDKEYDYARYGEYLKKSKEVWCPSKCTVKRTKQWFGIESVVVKSFVEYFDYDDIQDGGYILNALRKIPDKQVDWFSTACEEMGLPYKETNHLLDYGEYQRELAHCRFLVSPFHELSTGGLSIVEAYYLGKPVLLSDSPWHGGRDYLGGRAQYFDHANYDNFKAKLFNMYHKSLPYEFNAKNARRWVKNNYHERVMAQNICKRLQSQLREK